MEVVRVEVFSAEEVNKVNANDDVYSYAIAA